MELRGCMFAAVQVQASSSSAFRSPTSPTRISKKFGLFVRASCDAFGRSSEAHRAKLGPFATVRKGRVEKMSRFCVSLLTCRGFQKSGAAKVICYDPCYMDSQRGQPLIVWPKRMAPGSRASRFRGSLEVQELPPVYILCYVC